MLGAAAAILEPLGGKSPRGASRKLIYLGLDMQVLGQRVLLLCMHTVCREGYHDAGHLGSLLLIQ